MTIMAAFSQLKQPRLEATVAVSRGVCWVRTPAQCGAVDQDATSTGASSCNCREEATATDNYWGAGRCVVRCTKLSPGIAPCKTARQPNKVRIRCRPVGHKGLDHSFELRCSPQQTMFPTGGGGEGGGGEGGGGEGGGGEGGGDGGEGGKGGGEAAVQTELAPLGAAVRVQHSAADCCTVAPTGKHLQQVGRQLGGEASWACRAIVTLWQLQGQKTAAGDTHTQYGPNA